MAWEERGHKRYYYWKRRQDGRVVSTYLGNGEYARLIAASQSHLAIKEAQQRAAERERRAEIEAFDQVLDNLGALLRTLTEATLVTNGFHQHKRQWRRRRAHRD